MKQHVDKSMLGDFKGVDNRFALLTGLHVRDSLNHVGGGDCFFGMVHIAV